MLCIILEAWEIKVDPKLAIPQNSMHRPALHATEKPASRVSIQVRWYSLPRKKKQLLHSRRDITMSYITSSLLA